MDIVIPESGEVVKPKRKAAKKKKKAKKEETPQGVPVEIVTATLQGVSELVATIPNMGHWGLSESESKEIAKPLCNIISKNENLMKLADHSDGIALCMACATIFIPRAMISYTMIKENHKMKQHKVSEGEKKNDRKDGKSSNNNGENGKVPTSTHEDVFNPTDEILSAPLAIY